MRTLLSILGALTGLAVALFIVDRSVHAARKYHRHYITIGRKEYSWQV